MNESLSGKLKESAAAGVKNFFITNHQSVDQRRKFMVELLFLDASPFELLFLLFSPALLHAFRCESSSDSIVPAHHLFSPS